MSTAYMSEPLTSKSLQDPALKEKLQELRRTDNLTNWYYLIRTWLYLAAVIGGTIWFYHHQQTSGISFWWNVPVTILAVILIGAGQHQLSGLSHEAAHHILFRNRILNDLVSDLCCMFPMFSSTHLYRLQHLAHHQFVNDPIRDPDVSQLQSSGHWLPFPLPKKQFLWTLVQQLWVPNLIKYMRIRAMYNAVSAIKNPYLKKNVQPNKTPIRVGIVYMAGLVLALTLLVWHGDPLWLAVVPTALWLAILAFYALIPEPWFLQVRVHPVIPTRYMSLLRVTFVTVLFCGLAWITWWTGKPAWFYFFLLWLVPIFTSFSFFMILRQLVQHGNGGRGWLTNTRVFLVHPFINFAVFPLGQDYHLPHHLFATVPHYRLKQLHELLLQYPEYQEQAVVVEGYFLPRERPPKHPTVLDVLGPDYAPNRHLDVYIDNTVLEGVRVEEKDAILREGEEEIRRHRAEMRTSQ
ncbi:MAG: fatty acid desaturase family protein [Gemmataceae bacterium]